MGLPSEYSWQSKASITDVLESPLPLFGEEAASYPEEKEYVIGLKMRPVKERVKRQRTTATILLLTGIFVPLLLDKSPFLVSIEAGDNMHFWFLLASAVLFSTSLLDTDPFRRTRTPHKFASLQQVRIKDWYNAHWKEESAKEGELVSNTAELTHKSLTPLLDIPGVRLLPKTQIFVEESDPNIKSKTITAQEEDFFVTLSWNKIVLVTYTGQRVEDNDNTPRSEESAEGSVINDLSDYILEKVAQYQSFLGGQWELGLIGRKKPEVRGLVMIHPGDTGIPVHSPGQTAYKNSVIASPRETVEMIGEWFTEDRDTVGMVDRQLLVSLLPTDHSLN